MEITHACVLPWMQDAEGKSQLDTSLSPIAELVPGRESCRIKVPSIPTLSSGVCPLDLSGDRFKLYPLMTLGSMAVSLEIVKLTLHRI